MNRTWILRSLMVVLVILLAVPALAGKVLDGIVERGEIRIGMTGNQPPLNVKSKTGSLIGFEVDLAEVLAGSMGVKAKLVVKPFRELLPALAAGELDMIISGMTITPERNTRAAFVGPYVLTGKSVLTKSSKLAAADETEDINAKSLTLAALEGSTSQQFVERLAPKATLIKTKDYDEALKLVLEGQADALVADMEMCQLAVLRYPEAGLATLREPLTIEPIGIALPPDDSLLVNLVENYLAALEMTGLLEELHDKWYSNGSWLLQIP